MPRYRDEKGGRGRAGDNDYIDEEELEKQRKAEREEAERKGRAIEERNRIEQERQRERARLDKARREEAAALATRRRREEAAALAESMSPNLDKIPPPHRRHFEIEFQSKDEWWIVCRLCDAKCADNSVVDQHIGSHKHKRKMQWEPDYVPEVPAGQVHNFGPVLPGHQIIASPGQNLDLMKIPDIDRRYIELHGPPGDIWMVCMLCNGKKCWDVNMMISEHLGSKEHRRKVINWAQSPWVSPNAAAAVPDARIPGVNALPLWVPGIVSGNGPYVPAAGGAPYVPAAPSAGPARGQQKNAGEVVSMEYWPKNYFPHIWDQRLFPPEHGQWLVCEEQAVVCFLCQSRPYSYEQLNDHIGSKNHVRKVNNEKHYPSVTFPIPVDPPKNGRTPPNYTGLPPCPPCPPCPPARPSTLPSYASAGPAPTPAASAWALPAKPPTPAVPDWSGGGETPGEAKWSPPAKADSPHGEAAAWGAPAKDWGAPSAGWGPGPSSAGPAAYASAPGKAEWWQEASSAGPAKGEGGWGAPKADGGWGAPKADGGWGAPQGYEQKGAASWGSPAWGSSQAWQGGGWEQPKWTAEETAKWEAEQKAQKAKWEWDQWGQPKYTAEEIAQWQAEQKAQRAKWEAWEQQRQETWGPSEQNSWWAANHGDDPVKAQQVEAPSQNKPPPPRKLVPDELEPDAEPIYEEPSAGPVLEPAGPPPGRASVQEPTGPPPSRHMPPRSMDLSSAPAPPPQAAPQPAPTWPPPAMPPPAMAPPSQPSWMALGYTTVSQSEFFCECCGIEFADVKEAAIHCAGYCTQCNTSKKETIEEAIRSGEINTPYVRHHVQSLESVHSYYQPMLLDDKLFFVDIKTFRRYSEDECRTWIHSHLKEQYEEWFGPPSTWEKEGFGTPKICKMTSQSLDQLRLKTESFSMC